MNRPNPDENGGNVRVLPLSVFVGPVPAEWFKAVLSIALDIRFKKK
jgi:hypothetical protein